MSRRRYRTQTTARRRTALIGVAAILFQAFLFGWHHHALALPGGSGPIASIHSADQPLAPATAEDLCEICVVLHQQTAAPLAFFLRRAPRRLRLPAVQSVRSLYAARLLAASMPVPLLVLETTPAH